MKKLIIPVLTSVMTLLSAACASHGMAQSPTVALVAPSTTPMTLLKARAELGMHEGTYELVSSEDPTHQFCGEVTPTWSNDNGPIFRLDMMTAFTDFNRGVMNEKSGAETGNCINAIKTVLSSHQILYTMIENQNCPADYSRLDSNLTVNGDIMIYNFHKTWKNPKVHDEIKAQCVLKLKK